MTPSRPGSPRVDDEGATFAWHGSGEPPVVAGSWCGWDPARGLEMHRAPDGGWEARLDLPPDAYAEYRLYRNGEVVTDRANPDRVDNGVNGRNHRFWMPRARRRAMELVRRSVPRGEVRRVSLDVGWLAAPPQRRRAALYLPAGAAEDARARQSLPLLLVLDGLDYLRRGGLAEILDGLIADGAMRPVAAAFIDHAGDGRPNEYAANDFTVASLADVVVPAAVELLDLGPQGDAERGRAAILGSSLGGLMALHAGLRRPDVFGHVIAQSTSAMLDELPLRDSAIPAVRLTTLALLEAVQPPPVRVWLDVGELEDLAPSNDRLAALLAARGVDVTYRRFPGGHDQTSWAESLVDALPATFPPAGANGGPR